MAVGSNVADAPALERARERGVATAVFARADYADRPARDAAMAAWLQERGARLIVLAGYMQLLSPAFLERFPQAVINVHPSLLPAFPGLHAVEQALAYGVKVFGVTVHFVDAGLDSGPVILQGAVELPQATTTNEVFEHLRPLEHALLPEAVRLLARGRREPGCGAPAPGARHARVNPVSLRHGTVSRRRARRPMGRLRACLGSPAYERAPCGTGAGGARSGARASGAAVGVGEGGDRGLRPRPHRSWSGDRLHRRHGARARRRRVSRCARSRISRASRRSWTGA